MRIARSSPCKTESPAVTATSVCTLARATDLSWNVRLPTLSTIIRIIRPLKVHTSNAPTAASSVTTVRCLFRAHQLRAVVALLAVVAVEESKSRSCQEIVGLKWTPPPTAIGRQPAASHAFTSVAARSSSGRAYAQNLVHLGHDWPHLAAERAGHTLREVGGGAHFLALQHTEPAAATETVAAREREGREGRDVLRSVVDRYSTARSCRRASTSSLNFSATLAACSSSALLARLELPRVGSFAWQQQLQADGAGEVVHARQRRRHCCRVVDLNPHGHGRLHDLSRASGGFGH
eukprot:scaffold75764_cov63-Phaeocystis_antarctica.AAC.1